MKLAVIGCGKQGARHLAALRGSAELVAADIDAALADAVAARFGAQPLSIDAVFADPAIAAIAIAAPTPFHAALAGRAVAACKHVFCEKPFGADVAAARRIASDAAARALVGQAGYLYRFAPAIRAARDAATSLGRIEAARLAIAAPGNHARWKHRRDSGGGVANELVCHLADLALWCFGPMRECTLLDRRQTTGRRTIGGEVAEVDADDRVAACLVSQSGVTIHLDGDFAAPRFAQSVEIRGALGLVRASIDPAFDSFVQHGATRKSLTPHDNPDLHRLQMRAFLDAIAQRAPSQACDLDQAADVCALLEQMQVAAA